MRENDPKKKHPLLKQNVAFTATGGLAILLVFSILTMIQDVSGTSYLPNITKFQLAFLVTLTSLALAFRILQVAKREREGLNQLRRDQAAEINHWQARWQKLHRETQEATSALSRMRDGVILLGDHEEILLVNPAARRLLAISQSPDITLRPFRESVRLPELNRAINAANTGDGEQNLLLEFSDGTTLRPLKIRVDRFGTASDKHLLITIRDETAASRVESMRREFIANISHELKTPLAAIKGYAETVELAITDDPEAASHFMKQIHSQCLRLERLIADMMQLARAQAGPSQMNLINTSMRQAIEESIRSHEPVSESKKISIHYADPLHTAIVRADPEALLTISNNLLGNAVRYTPKGGQINISTRDAGTHWALVVEDTGIGIKESDQKRIFERFYRVGQRSGSADGGTGIGLSIVKNLTLTLNGEVRLSSHPGKGAKFEVLLPKAESTAKPA